MINEVPTGTEYVQVAGGGGGWGEPTGRDAQAVRREVRDGLVSLEAAHEVYGVVLDPVTFEVDERATEAARKER